MLTQSHLWYKTLLLSTLLLLNACMAMAFTNPNDSVTLPAKVWQEGIYLYISYEIPDSLHGKEIYLKPEITRKNSSEPVNVMRLCGDAGRMIASAGTKTIRWDMKADEPDDLKEVKTHFSLTVIDAERVNVPKITGTAIIRPLYARNKIDCIDLNTKNCIKRQKKNRWVGLGIGALAMTAGISAITSYVDFQAVNKSNELSQYNRWQDYCKMPQNNIDKTYCEHKKAGIIALSAASLFTISIGLNTGYVNKHSKAKNRKFLKRRRELEPCPD